MADRAATARSRVAKTDTNRRNPLRQPILAPPAKTPSWRPRIRSRCSGFCQTIAVLSDRREERLHETYCHPSGMAVRCEPQRWLASFIKRILVSQNNAAEKPVISETSMGRSR